MSNVLAVRTCSLKNIRSYMRVCIDLTGARRDKRPRGQLGHAVTPSSDTVAGHEPLDSPFATPSLWCVVMSGAQAIKTALVITLFALSTAFAHMTLIYPPPRATNDDISNLNSYGPCGVASTNERGLGSGPARVQVEGMCPSYAGSELRYTKFEPGSVIPIRWNLGERTILSFLA
jgi:hypothetical protein